MRLGANICVAHTCHCGKRVEWDGLHGLSCTKSAGRFSRHATLNSLIKQTLGSLDLPSMLEPRGLYRTDGKRPDGVTMIPWEMSKQLVWDVTVVDALAPSGLNQGSLCNPGTTATEVEARKIEKYRELIDNGYIFQPEALEVQGSSGGWAEIGREQDVSAKKNSRRFGKFFLQIFLAIFFAETSAAMFLPKRLLPKRPEFISSTTRICPHFL